MPVFKYKALDNDGKVTTGLLDASSPQEARKNLRNDNLYVVEIVVQEEKGEHPKAKAQTPFYNVVLDPIKRLFVKRNRIEIALITRQFATLLSSGVPVADSLDALVEQIADANIESVFRDIREKIHQGMNLHEAMALHPRYFNTLYVNMIKAGEASGNLDKIMERLAEYVQKQTQLSERIKSALIYPFIIGSFGLIVVIFLLTFVLPQIIKVLKDAGKVLPTSTSILLGISNIITNYWYIIIIVIIGIIVLVDFIKRTKSGRWWFDYAKLRIPVMGSLLRKKAISQFAMTFATLSRSGLPVLDCLAIVENVLDNVTLKKTINELRQSISDGTDISSPLKKSGIFPPVISYMISVGEKTGKLDEILGKIAIVYDEDIEVSSKRLTSILEPVLILVMAVVVGFIVMSILMPILQLGQTL